MKRSKKEEGKKIALRIGIYCFGASFASLLFVLDPRDINYEYIILTRSILLPVSPTCSRVFQCGPVNVIFP